ncbi:hypothetical protein N2152v2_006132 [Parachlorella kessleri]
MTDHAAEQEMELEALEAIYMDDLQVRIEVVFAHTPTYPDEPPLLKARGLQGLADADVRQLQGVLDEQIEANLGMAMIYTLIGVAQEWLNEKALTVGGPSLDPEADRKRREAEEEARIAELRAHGTAVTPETFAEWKARFDAEQALERAKLQGGEAADKRGRLTGKQWFLQQEAMHREVEEPDLEPDEEDGEDEGNYSDDSEGESEEEVDFDAEDSEDDEDFLDEMEEKLAEKSGA